VPGFFTLVKKTWRVLLFTIFTYFSGMFIKSFFVLLVFAVTGYTEVSGQQGDFCSAVAAITRDAPNKFRNVRGQLIAAKSNATTWACSIKVPGTISSRFVASMGLFYEGGFFQAKNKEEIKAVYEKYKSQLSGCLLPQGYKLSLQENFYPGLEDYKKLVYMQEVKEEDTTAKSPPAHITMEATYSRQLGLYTVVMYIFEH